MKRFTKGTALPDMKPFRRKVNPPIHAIQVNEEFRVEFARSAVIGKPGDWLVRFWDGSLSVVDNEFFAGFYEEIGEEE